MESVLDNRLKNTNNITVDINLLLTEREGRTGEYWPDVVAVRTERSEDGLYGEIPTEKEPIRTLGFTLPYNN